MAKSNPDNTFNEKLQKAFEYSIEAAKLLITVATGMVAFTVIFTKDFVGGVNVWIKLVAVASWLCYFFSVIMGVLFIQTLVGQLDTGDEKRNSTEKPTIWASSAVRMAKLQQIIFLIGLFLTLAFGALALYYPEEKPVSPCLICAPSPISNTQAR